MRPGIRMIQEELRREAERVPVPTDMWERISAELEQDLRRQQRRRRVLRRLQTVRPLLVVTLVGGVLGSVLWACPADVTREAQTVQTADGGRYTAFLRPPNDNLRAGYFTVGTGWQPAAEEEAGRGSLSARIVP